MVVKEFKTVDGIPLIMCPPYLIPQFQLWDMLEDGTKRYIINLTPYEQGDNI